MGGCGLGQGWYGVGEGGSGVRACREDVGEPGRV